MILWVETRSIKNRHLQQIILLNLHLPDKEYYRPAVA